MAQLPLDALYPGVLDGLIKQEALVVRAQQLGVDEEPVGRRRVKPASDRQLAEEFLRSAISKGITETALLDRYNRHVAGHPGEEEVHARVILVETEKEAADLIAELRGGADFATVARRASKDTTAPVGGDLGFHTRTELSAEVGAVAFSLPVGQFAGYPLRMSAGWFIIKSEERRRQATPSFASVREQLREELLREGVEAASEAAIKDMKVRRYSFTGDDEADKAVMKPSKSP